MGRGKQISMGFVATDAGNQNAFSVHAGDLWIYERAK
jgi:hypothetical protein